jgi:glycosyltransferase involved in cell wall biosynthesis
MARLLVLATGPLFDRVSRVVSGQSLRTWHFVAPLRGAGHTVRLVTVPIPGATREDAPATEQEHEGLSYMALGVNDPARVLPLVAAEIARFAPEALVGINAWPAFLLALLDRPEPLWADLNGWTMAEGQTRAVVVGHDDDFPHFWRMEALVALTAARFSAVTARQADALHGELAMLGALHRGNAAAPLVDVVPNAVHPDYAALTRGGPPPAIPGLAPGARIVLWSGGFNTWTNVDLLVGAMARAMESDPAIHLVCTGGAVLGHDESTYRRFESLSAASLPAGRVHRLGWTDQQTVLALHATAAVGINIDGNNVETRFGARNRLTNMLGAGLPVVTTAGTEIADWIAAGDYGAVVPAESDAAQLAAAIVAAAAGGPAVEARAARARAAALDAFAPATTLGGFLAWASNPAAGAPPPAPDTAPGRLRAFWRRECLAGVPALFHPPAPPAPVWRRAVRRLRRATGL